MPKNLTKPFLLILIFLVTIGCYLVFRPFLTEILMAAILATIFYRPFTDLSKFLRGQKHLAALLLCLLLVLVVILPSVKLMIYGAERSVETYDETVVFFSNHDLNDVFKNDIFKKAPLSYLNLNTYNFQNTEFQNTILSAFKASSGWIISVASSAITETTNFFFSLFLIILTMFFFFIDGKKMLQRLMYLSPLPNKYDEEIFRKFKVVSYTTLVSTFVAALAQGIAGAIGFAVVGFPVFLAFVLVSVLSLLPYLGSMLFYVPVGIYYLMTGEIWRGVFVLVWGFVVIGLIDNFIRAYMIKDEAEINPIFVFFSILGGIAFMGFWGVIIGPLIVALAVTVYHIYELEFCSSLDGCDCEEIKQDIKENTPKKLFQNKK
ncbi:MAG: AI-2E family transporter [Patescibacteria group bacterium]